MTPNIDPSYDIHQQSYHIIDNNQQNDIHEITDDSPSEHDTTAYTLHSTDLMTDTDGIASYKLQQLQNDYNKTINAVRINDAATCSDSQSIDNAECAIIGDSDGDADILSSDSLIESTYTPLPAHRIDTIKSIMSTINLPPPKHIQNNTTAGQYVDNILLNKSTRAISPYNAQYTPLKANPHTHNQWVQFQ